MANPENLLKGGVPGNKGGTGRPPSALRAAMREILEAKGLDKLERIVTGEEDGVSPGESLKAIDICGKFGLGEAKAVLPDELLKAVASVAAEYLSPEDMEPFTDKLIQRIKEVS
jgi:hypothetical protein